MEDDDGKLSIFSSNNEDIIVEILSWLPVICLLRFRCVCKSWRALISTPHFFDKHRARTNDNDNNKNVLILFNRSPRRADYWESHDSLPSRFPQLIDYQSLKKKKNVAASASASAAAAAIPSRRRNLEDEFPDDTFVRDSSLAGSCNGLICLLGKYEGACERRDMFIKWYGNNRLLLWNPSTRKARKLPDIDCFRFGPIYYGFGYDSTTQDYKVLLGGGNSPDDPGLVAIFALKTGSWKMLEAASEEIDGRGCFLNGALHWNLFTSHRDGGTRTRICCFDFAQEKFHSFSFVRHKPLTPSKGTGLGTIGNRLSFYTSRYKHADHHALEDGLTIWVMMEYGVDQSWTIFAKIRFEIFPPDVKWLMPIYHLEDDGKVLMRSSQGDFVLYIPKEEEEEEDTCIIALDNPGIPSNPYFEEPDLTLEAVMYVETLVSPVTGDG